MGFATTEKVAAGFKAAGERLDSVQNDLDEIREVGKMLQRQLKRMYQTISAGNGAVDTGGRFGIWATEEQAKTFGYCAMAALGKRFKDMGEITQVGGGVLVPDQTSSRLIDLLPKYGKFRANTTVFPMESASTVVPRITSDLTVYVPGEGGPITPSDGTMGSVRMTPKTWAALCAVSNELEEDSVTALGVILGISITRSMAKNEDLCGFLGDGSATYFSHKGIVGEFMSISNTISEIAGLKVASGNAYSEITLQDFEDTAALLPSEFDDAAKWYVNKRFYHKVMKKLANTTGVASMLDILSDKKTRAFLEYPVEFVPCLPYVEGNSQICAILGDLSMGSYIGQRKELTIEKNDSVYFASNRMAVRGIERIDMAIFGCGNTSAPGPIVGLITAAA